MEIDNTCNWYRAVNLGFVLLSSPGLGYSYQSYHGDIDLSDSVMEHARFY